ASAFRAAAGRSRKCGHPKCGHAGQAWNPACTWNPASGGRSSGTGRCPRGARACIWVQYNEPCGFPLDTTTLRRTAAVVRHGRDIGNARDLDAQGIQSTHRRLTAGAGALDAHFEGLDAVFQRDAAGGLGGHLRGERRRLARAFEARATRSRPRQGIALAVGDGDDGVVERRVNVRNAVRDVLLNLFAHARSAAGGSFRHNPVPRLFLQGRSSTTRALTGPGVGASALAAHGQTALVTHTAVGSQVDQTLDRELYFTTQVAFNREQTNMFADAFQFSVVQILDLFVKGYVCRFADFASARTTNAKNGGQSDLGVLLRRDVNASNTGHDY